MYSYASDGPGDVEATERFKRLLKASKSKKPRKLTWQKRQFEELEEWDRNLHEAPSLFQRDEQGARGGLLNRVQAGSIPAAGANFIYI